MSLTESLLKAVEQKAALGEPPDSAIEPFLAELHACLGEVRAGRFEEARRLCEEYEIDMAEALASLPPDPQPAAPDSWEWTLLWAFGKALFSVALSAQKMHLDFADQRAIALSDAVIALLKELPIEQSHEYRNALANAWINRGVALERQKTAGSLREAVANYDAAIALRKELPIEQSLEYRNALANAWMNRGVALECQNTAGSLCEAVASFDTAIALMKELPIEQSLEYRQALANGWMNRGIALQRQNTVGSLREAVTSYDAAIALRKELPIEQSLEYRYELAVAWMNRGTALQGQNTAGSLREAVASCDAAIALMKELPIEQSHEYRNDLAGAWMNRGNALDRQKTAASLREAVASYDAAIALMKQLPIEQSHEYRNDLASAWMNRGIALESQNTARSLREAVASYDAAIALMKELPIEQSHVYRHALANAWMNRGIALQNQNTARSLREAVASYDTAIALMKESPIEQSHEYRNALADAWMNRGIALQGQNTAESLCGAVASYDAAIALMKELPIEQSHEYRNALARAWMNRGHALRNQNTARSLREAVASFDTAIALSNELPIEQSHEYRNALAQAWVNRGLALEGQNTAGSLREAVTSYREAGELVKPITPSFLTALETCLKSARGFVETAIRIHADEAELLDEAIEVVDGAMEVARYWEDQGVHFQREWAEEAFRLGIHAYQLCQPQFVGEFALECLDPDTSPGAMPESAAMHETAQQGLELAIHILNQPYHSAPNKDRWIKNLRDALARLLRVRRRYFAGTLAATQLHVAFHDRAGDPENAKRRWEEHVLFQPEDVAAWVAYGDWQAKRSQWREAERIYQRALETFPESFAASSPREALAPAAALVCRKLADLRIAHSPALVQIERQARSVQLIESYKAYDDARDELLKLHGQWTADAAREGDAAVRMAMAEGLEQVIADLKREREGFREEDVKEHLKAVQMTAERVLLIHFYALTHALERTWTAAASGLRAALKSITEMAQEEFQMLATGAESERSEEDVTELIAEAIQRATGHHLAQTALDESDPDDATRVREAMGELFDALPANEQRYLVFAETLARDPHLLCFAAASYGLTLENELVHHVFAPLKETLRQRKLAEAIRIEFDDSKDSREAALGRYLNGEWKNMTLGQMVPPFCKSVFARTDLHRSVFAEVNGWVQRSFPNPDLLLTLPPESAKDQARRLELVKEIRNRSAHPAQSDGNLTREDVARGREALIGPGGF